MGVQMDWKKCHAVLGGRTLEEEVRALAQKNMTAKEIAQNLSRRGFKVSRSAVSGGAHRNGIKLNGNHSQSVSREKYVVDENPKPKLPRVSTTRPKSSSSTAGPGKRRVSAPGPYLDEEDEKAAGVPFLEIGDRQCRVVLRGTTCHDLVFCGRRTDSGRVLRCPKHGGPEITPFVLPVR